MRSGRHLGANRTQILRQLITENLTLGIAGGVLGIVLAWFCLDSADSIASGNPSNALFNVLVSTVAVGLLWVPAKSENVPPS